jgi:hypothetical protein
VPSLSHQRCLNHAAREAVARCPECKQHFCRECVVEHEDRLLCAACLKKRVELKATARARLTGFVRFAQVALGVLTAWFFFYSAGRILLSIPTAVHEGAVWKSGSLEER